MTKGNAGRHAQVSPAPQMREGFVDQMLMKIRMVPDTAPGGCNWVGAGCPANASFKARRNRFAKASHDLASDLNGPMFQHLGPGTPKSVKVRLVKHHSANTVLPFAEP